METYGYKQQKINELNNIDNNSNNFYIYNGLNFLSKLNSKNENIIISFHGATKAGSSGINRIIFRGYDWEIQNTDIICVCDYLINVYNEVQTNWFLSTKKFDSDSIYIEVFSYIFSQKKYKNIIFTGSSAGGFPSIKFSCYFKEKAIITNSQLYLEKHRLFKSGRILWGDGRHSVLDIMNKYNDIIIYKKKDIEKFVLKNLPKQVLIYQNIQDVEQYQEHFLYFKEFILNNKLDKIFILKDFICKLPKFNKTVSPHSIRFPNNQKHEDFLKRFLNYNESKIYI
jgi:hypothetical protein